MSFIPKVTKTITLPVLKLEVDHTRYVKIVDKMFRGKDLKAKAGEAQRAPATICNAVNLEDGTQVQVVVPAVLKSIFEEEYPADAYVGKCFSVTKREKQKGKAYNPYDVSEIEDPAASPAVPAENAAPVSKLHAKK